MFGIGKVENLPPWAEELPALLPHGSGIDYDWYITGMHGYIRCTNGFHAMNDGGFFHGDYSNKLATKHMLRDYLGDTIAHALGDLEWGKGVKRVLRKSDAIDVLNKLEAIKIDLDELNDSNSVSSYVAESREIIRNSLKELEE